MATICKFCECNIEKDYPLREDKSFEQLVAYSSSKVHEFVPSKEKLGRLGVIRWLLKHACQIKLDSSQIESIVDECAYSCEDDIADILKKNKLNIRIETEIFLHRYCLCSTKWQRSAFYIAITKGTPEIISWILNNSINSHIELKDLQAMVTDAVINNNIDNIMHLVSLGVKITSEDQCKDKSFLSAAAQCGNLHIIKWIYENNLVNKDCNSWVFALRNAMKFRHYDVIQYLVEVCKVNINSISIQSEPIIHLAVNHDNIELMKWLVKKGANLFQKCSANKTALHIAAEQGKLDLLRWLHSVAIEKNEKFDMCHPSILITSQHLDCIEYLVHRNYDVNVDRGDGFTPLHFAATMNNLVVFKFLLQHGANPHIKYYDHFNTRKNSSGISLLHSACNNLEMIKDLVALGLDINAKNAAERNVLYLAAQKDKNIDAVQWLLAQGLPLDDVLATSKAWLLDMNYHKDDTLLLLVLKYMSDKGMDIDTLIEGETLLHRAAGSCLEAVKILIAHKADINARRTKDHNTPLICSLEILDGVDEVMSNQSSNSEPLLPEVELYITQYLLAQGADVNLKDVHGETALHHVMESRNIDVINQLIELGADVNNARVDGGSVLMEAVNTGILEIVKIIIKAGANINHVDTKNTSAINIAGKNNYWKIVRYLVKKGANPGNKPHRENPIICEALKTGDLELVSYLVDHNALIDNDLYENNAILLHGCQWFKNESDKYELIKILVNHGVSLGEMDGNDDTILHKYVNNIEIVNFLLQNCEGEHYITRDVELDVIIEVDFVNYENNDYKTALHILCTEHIDINSYNKIMIVNKLLKHGANVNTKDTKDLTPLHSAVTDPIHTDIARILVSKGADINAKDTNGNSVLHFTANGELAIWLCEQGADINAKNNDGVSVLQVMIQNLCKQTSNNNIIHVLQSQIYGNNHVTSNAMKSILHSRMIYFIKYLIDNVVNIDEQDKHGLTALQYIARLNYDNVTTLIHMLLQKGANITHKTKDGETLLHIAVTFNNLAIVSLILNILKPELAMVGDNKNRTPLHYAVLHLTDVNIIHTMLKYDINIDIKDNDGLTALDLAIKLKHVNIAQILTDHANKMV